MRVLVASTAGAGHFGPLVPFAAACASAGHEVRVAAPASFRSAVEHAGFELIPFADAAPEDLGAVFAVLPELSVEDANAKVISEVFAGFDARAALPGMAEAVDAWRPDVIVRDPSEFASYVVAEQKGIPQVEVAIGVGALETFAMQHLDEPLRALGAPRGVDGLFEVTTFSLVPECMEDPDDERRRSVDRFRYEAPAATGPGQPADWSTPSDTPLVYASFGTIASTIGFYPAVYKAVIDVVASLPIRLLMTIGKEAEPAALGPVPDNVRVERFWPQQDVMPVAGSVIGHGGFGTTMTALAYGVPMVVLPLFSIDQFFNASAVERVGAGIGLEGGPAAASQLAAALVRTLDDEALRVAAQRVAKEIEQLPAADESIATIEAVARG